MSIPKPTLMVFLFLLLTNLPCAVGSDWPMWRGDAQRSASTSDGLPEQLTLLWKRVYSQREQAWDDPLNLDMMTYDRVFEPVILDGRLFMGFNDRDKFVAFDADSGDELWTFFTDAPVRVPPAASNGKVYFTSDDGNLYCVSADKGELIWKFGGAPSNQKAIGNQRFVSVWPARGGPVIRDNTVYFAASIWPMMGTFIYSLDAESGAVQWLNDSTGAQYIKQPHSAPSFAGVAPQGALVATENHLIVPGGRSVPAVFDRDSGTLKHFEINSGGKGTGGTFIAADESRFYLHTRLKGTRAFDIESGVKTAFMPNEPVLADGIVYSVMVNEETPVIRAFGEGDKLLWEIESDGRGDMILAGDRLYAAGENEISVIQLPTPQSDAKVIAAIPVDGRIERLLAGDDKLVAVTLDGSILAFGETAEDAPRTITEEKQPLQLDDDSQATVAKLVSDCDTSGYALFFGATDESLVMTMAEQPFTQLAVIDSDSERVERLRSQLDAAGLYGRTTAHVGNAQTFLAPSYIAHLIVVGAQQAANASGSEIETIYESVRPYGGTLRLLAEDNHAELAARVQSLNLEQAQVTIDDDFVTVQRIGALPGSADWTHQHGDVANTIKSDDRRVKLPLGVLWFGGSSNMDVLPRHGHGPPEQVVGGRLFIQGMNSLSARDVYTGRVLWKREFEDLGTYDVYYDETYEDTPLDPKYNQVHIPGANGRSTNYVVTDDRIYIVEGSRCHVLDPSSGETIQKLELPMNDSGERPQWGYIGVYEDLLLAGYGFASYRDRLNLKFSSDEELRRNRAGFGSKSLDRAASMSLIAFDRHTGELLWKNDAVHSFWHNGIVAGGGRIYCLDRTPELIAAALRRRGVSNADTYRIASFDAKTGKLNWEITDGVFGTWLGYSEEHDLLLQAGASASDRLYAEVGQGMAVYQADSGDVQWKNDSISYAGPCILHNDWIFTNANSYRESAGAFHLVDGHPKLVANPLTGELQPWKLTRAYGCNTVIASENLLTFRSGAAGFYDLLSESGTGNFGGFKSGCTSNLVVANGVLNAPDYTRTCSCAYQNQTSLALVHMPDLEFWTINPAVGIQETTGRLKDGGINFGAPGDRSDENGVVWLEHPPVAGPSAPINIQLNDDAKIFSHHSTSVGAAEPAWVLASGIENVTDLTIDLNLKQRVDLKSGIPVGHANDDVEEAESGDVSSGSSDLEIVEDGGNQTVGLRFTDIPLARGTTIRSAYLQFTCDEASDVPTSVVITAEATGNAKEFESNSHNVSSRAQTAAKVDWKPEPWTRPGAATEAERTPDLSALIQEIVNREDWKPGNSIALMISGTGKRVAVSSSGRGQKGAARLLIDAEEADDSQGEGAVQRQYELSLYFGLPRNADSNRRRFDVAIGDEVVLHDIALQRNGNADQEAQIHHIKTWAPSDRLKLRFLPKEGQPVLSGIEIHEVVESEE
ncbi:outer membrane biogenesis protein BamB [Thalassoglobus neptunius]|uniref:Outer membrane biogenesis protein BamB n=1 Tax=Thalassoglobus neptunius TaxID=1938619 RepID=A0A5C5W5U6_9PLAN|nr:PQQ-binding-like beta-propeller repeat protein [Thalassoglobus neptunius]TWT46338.1 outer membrane biogenesis protein BamB [Thalassoglobus neptunius]